MSTFTSHWRCDPCGETFSVELTPVLVDEETGEESEIEVDVMVETMRCTICGVGMRRVESLGDLRPWGASLG